MVNLVKTQKSLVRVVAKCNGLLQVSFEIEPGTVMSFWLPKHNDIAINKIKNNNKKKNKKMKKKPSILLIHGFAADGLYTWQFQLASLTSKYDVYVPDLLFFGGSTTSSPDRSPEFQAKCLAAGLDLLGVRRCTAVGLSYGGMVAFKLVEARPELVEALVISGSSIALTDSIRSALLKRTGFASLSDLLLPSSVKGLKELMSIGTYKLWFPDFLHRHYLKVMFNNRKEMEELLEGMVVNDHDAVVPVLTQKILLLWGEHDKMFTMKHVTKMKEQLGDKVMIQAIREAGHLVHIERPFAFLRRLKEFLALVYEDGPKE